MYTCSAIITWLSKRSTSNKLKMPSNATKSQNKLLKYQGKGMSVSWSPAMSLSLALSLNFKVYAKKWYSQFRRKRSQTKRDLPSTFFTIKKTIQWRSKMMAKTVVPKIKKKLQTIWIKSLFIKMCQLAQEIVLELETYWATVREMD